MLQARYGGAMSAKQLWFVTGAGRGMGVDFARAALAAGNAVVATGRNPDAVREAVGQAQELLVVKLDVTSPADAEAAVRAAVDRFGRIDVLVNNAANFYGGYFEELTPAQIEHQLATGLIGPMHVTRAVLPIMRQQRLGQARAGARHDRQPGAAAAPLHRWRRCHRYRRAEGEGPAGAGERVPRPV